METARNTLLTLIISLCAALAFVDGGFAQPPIGKAIVGGPISPDGQEVMCDIPPGLRHSNTGGRDGVGLCVFWSLTHAARFQGERRLWDFAEKMQREPGGGYPSKVDRMISKYAPGTPYIQYEGGDDAILVEAMLTGRPVSVTWDGTQDPNYRYRRIAHMVNLVHYDPPEKAGQRWACIMDNNFIGDNQLVWCERDSFLKGWKGNGGGWAVVLLESAPAPIPRN